MIKQDDINASTNSGVRAIERYLIEIEVARDRFVNMCLELDEWCNTHEIRKENVKVKRKPLINFTECLGFDVIEVSS